MDEQYLRQLNISQLRDWVRVDEKLLDERARVMNAIPECTEHGHQCVPHALEWIEGVQTRREDLVPACACAINTIAAMDAGLVRDGAAYVTMVQGTLAQLRAAVEGNDANSTATDPPERPRCQHETPPWLSYHGDQADTRKRLAKGERPKLCRVCGRWVWPEYWWRTIEEGETTLLDDAI